MEKGLRAFSGCLLAVALVSAAALALAAPKPAAANPFSASSDDHTGCITVDDTAKTLAGYVHIGQGQLDGSAAGPITVASADPLHPTDYLNLTFTVNLANRRHKPVMPTRRGNTIPARHTYSFASGGSIMLTGYINGRYIELTVNLAPGPNDTQTVKDQLGPNEVQTLVARYDGPLNATHVSTFGLKSDSSTGGLLQTKNNVAVSSPGAMSPGADASDPSSPVPIPAAVCLLASGLLGLALIRNRLK